MKVVISCKIPEHGLPLCEDVVSKEEVVSFLALAVEEGVVVVPLETFDHIAGVRGPLVDFAVRLHCIDELRTAVLDRYGVTVVVVHMGEHIYGVGVVGD